MARSLLVFIGLGGIFLAGHSSAAPPPTSKPKPRIGVRAFLYVKRVPGKTEKEQSEIRQKVRAILLAGVDKWVSDSATVLPGVKGDLSTLQRKEWRDQNIYLTYAEDTGVLRITCRAGTPQERALFVNQVVEQAATYYASQNKPTENETSALLPEILVLSLAESPPK